MKKICHLKNVVAGISLFFVMVSGFVQSSFSQDFISRESRPRWGVQYENFSNYDLRKYPGAEDDEGINPATYGPIDPVTFDRFGNFLLPVPPGGARAEPDLLLAAILGSHDESPCHTQAGPPAMAHRPHDKGC